MAAYDIADALPRLESIPLLVITSQRDYARPDGEKLYAENCAMCHGEGLTGIEMAPALAGDMFNQNWEGVALSDLLERMRSSMPQDKPGTLSRAQNADILAHMLRVGGFPAGDVPLEGQPGALAQIKFVTYKPQP